MCVLVFVDSDISAPTNASLSIVLIIKILVYIMIDRMNDFKQLTLNFWYKYTTSNSVCQAF